MTANKNLQQVKQLWSMINTVVFVPCNEEQYDQLVQVLNHLIDTSDGDENSPLAAMMDVVGALIENYDRERVPPFFE